MEGLVDSGSLAIKPHLPFSTELWSYLLLKHFLLTHTSKDGFFLCRTTNSKEHKKHYQSLSLTSKFFNQILDKINKKTLYPETFSKIGPLYPHPNRPMVRNFFGLFGGSIHCFDGSVLLTRNMPAQAEEGPVVHLPGHQIRLGEGQIDIMKEGDVVLSVPVEPRELQEIYELFQKATNEFPSDLPPKFLNW